MDGADRVVGVGEEEGGFSEVDGFAQDGLGVDEHVAPLKLDD